MFSRFLNPGRAISSVTGVWVALAISISVSAQTVSYPKIEASFNLTGLATDPFDYTVTGVRVQLQLPTLRRFRCRHFSTTAPARRCIRAHFSFWETGFVKDAAVSIAERCQRVAGG
jgi:hypothetical protein